MSIKIYVKYVKNNRDFHTTKLNLPTGNLDSKSGKIVLDALKEINGWGKTIIMVTHDPQMASNCKKVILLKDGVILKTLEGKGDSEEERERYYREILGEMEQL